MTFSDIKQRVYDLLGLTGESTLVGRLVNEAKDELVTAAKWWWLETTTSHLFTADTRTYTLGTDVSGVIGMFTSTGEPVEFVNRVTYENLYRDSSSTAANPEVYTVEGGGSVGQPVVNVWPTPGENSTGKVRYLKRIADMALDTESPSQIPAEFHHAIVKGAIAKFREWEDDPRADSARSDFEQTLAKLRGLPESDTVDEQT